MTLLKIWIHFVFSVKNHEPLLTDEIRHQLVRHVREATRAQKIYLDHIGGSEEHIHCLVSLGKEQTIAQVARLISDESAEWLNANGITAGHFSWENYYAVSVSESQADDVRKYIRNQEKYHRNKSFNEELNEFYRRYGWKKPSATVKKDEIADSLDFSDLEYK